MAFSIGISLDDFKHLNPKKLSYCLKGHKLKRQQRDEEMYMWLGVYGLSAVQVAVEHCLAGRKAKSKYVEEPITTTVEKQAKTEENLRKQRELFVAKLNVMKANFDLNKKREEAERERQEEKQNRTGT